MLDDIKQSYYEHANVLSNWKKLSGNELCFLYIKYKNENNPYLDNCLSAIIYKFWKVATKAFYAQGIKLASEEDCYSWLIDSIMYVLEHHVWDDPTHSLYKDKKAPEKAINVVFESTKINYFVAQTRQKRKIDATSISLDSISESVSDSYFLPVYDNYNFFENKFTELIISLYKGYKYFDAICVELILNENLIDNSLENDIKYNRLKKRLKELDDDYAKFFSATYNFPYEDVKKSVKYINSLNDSTIIVKLDRCFNELKRNQEILNIIE